jgi:hypothetical protein
MSKFISCGGVLYIHSELLAVSGVHYTCGKCNALLVVEYIICSGVYYLFRVLNYHLSALLAMD